MWVLKHQLRTTVLIGLPFMQMILNCHLQIEYQNCTNGSFCSSQKMRFLIYIYEYTAFFKLWHITHFYSYMQKNEEAISSRLVSLHVPSPALFASAQFFFSFQTVLLHWFPSLLRFIQLSFSNPFFHLKSLAAQITLTSFSLSTPFPLLLNRRLKSANGKCHVTFFLLLAHKTNPSFYLSCLDSYEI